MAKASPALVQLRTDLQAKMDEIEKETDPDKAEGLLDEAEVIRAKIQKLETNDQRAEALRSYNNDPVNRLPHQEPDREAVEEAARSGPLGKKGKVGETIIDLRTGNVVEETGAGVIPTSQLRAVVDPKYTRSFESWLRNSGQETKMERGVRADLMEGLDESAGFFVPPEMVAGIISRDPTPTRIVDLVQTVNISSDKAMMIKSNYNSDDLYSSAIRIYKTGEAQAAKKTDKPQFGLLSIDVHGWTAELTISKRLLEDTNFNILGYITQEFRNAQRNMSAQKTLLGEGNGEHFGLITRAGQANKGPDIIKNGHATILQWDALRKTKNQVPEQYEDNLRWLFNKRSTLDTVEAFKDENGRDLWPESQRAGGVNGTPGSLRGYPYSLEAFMPDIAANSIPILFGDFRGYARVARAGMTMQVLREIEARNGQVVFLVEFREGGDTVEPWRIKALKIAA